MSEKHIDFDGVLDCLEQFKNNIHKEHRNGNVTIPQADRVAHIKTIITALENEIIEFKFYKR